MTDDFDAVLTRLDAWLEVNAPADHAALRPPAAQADIDAVSDRRFPLHPDLARWLGRHDGVAATKAMTVPASSSPAGSSCTAPRK